ncbi:MAG: hypothetical protein COU47_00395 [Candidatus Niyogibacteria bacterium CG10_big_fil_rev_8_21_14_0_10_46_36]|uniref:Uncharacterized protein n=1 Tax=Candidatus Niyogibacteria bacterium CG10_big_fil_rev_8_21_14_0_10_46_36 TaxID=1974726 RepID=A0A2H0TG02_9BACT|nr:MAG: hypothetical protein COU47_00395 [Candidatus Niyogibacteria bacterium CG10_big_fil_rev_8_21_14_0_10_46_36]
MVYEFAKRSIQFFLLVFMLALTFSFGANAYQTETGGTMLTWEWLHQLGKGDPVPPPNKKPKHKKHPKKDCKKHKDHKKDKDHGERPSRPPVTTPDKKPDHHDKHHGRKGHHKSHQHSHGLPVKYRERMHKDHSRPAATPAPAPVRDKRINRNKHHQYQGYSQGKRYQNGKMERGRSSAWNKGSASQRRQHGRQRGRR